MYPSRRGFLLGAVAPLLATAEHAPGKRLLLDSRLVESAEHAHLALGTVVKHPANPLFGEEHPWEARFDNLSPNVVWDPALERYRCWYSPFIVDQRTTTTPPELRRKINYMAVLPARRELGICYAESDDGIRWRKPELGLVEFEGSRRNNLVARMQGECGIFLDAHESNPERRYKLVAHGRGTLLTRFSPDGIHWRDPVPCPEIQTAGDTHNNALWAPELEQ
jgi:hypothetical protein